VRKKSTRGGKKTGKERRLRSKRPVLSNGSGWTLDAFVFFHQEGGGEGKRNHFRRGKKKRGCTPPTKGRKGVPMEGGGKNEAGPLAIRSVLPCLTATGRRIPPEWPTGGGEGEERKFRAREKRVSVMFFFLSSIYFGIRAMGGEGGGGKASQREGAAPVLPCAVPISAGFGGKEGEEGRGNFAGGKGKGKKVENCPCWSFSLFFFGSVSLPRPLHDREGGKRSEGEGRGKQQSRCDAPGIFSALSYSREEGEEREEFWRKDGRGGGKGSLCIWNP